MLIPELTKFEIPAEDVGLFVTLDRVRNHLNELEMILEEYRSTEKTLAAQVFSKYGILPGKSIEFNQKVVHAVGGKMLPGPVKRQRGIGPPPPPPPGHESGSGEKQTGRKNAKGKKKKTPRR